MSSAIIVQRCLNHPTREAVARCVACRQTFCRECITEHDDRILCSACLKLAVVQGDTSRRRLRSMLAPFSLVLGLVVAWLFFYFAGRILVSIPTRFHEGTVWLNEGAM